MRAGAAQVDITPPAGTHLAGGVGVYRPAQAVADPLHARALVLEQDGRRVAIVTLEVTIITQPWTDRIRAAGEALGIPGQAIMVHAVQTHSAPSVGNFLLDDDLGGVPEGAEWVRAGEPTYYEQATAGAIRALQQAAASLEEVEVAAGSAMCDGLAHNRRGVTRDGSVVMPWLYSSQAHPLGPTHLRYLEGPTDREVGVVAFRNAAGRMVALLLHFTCHPVNVFAQVPNLVVSADWPGMWCDQMRRRCGEQCVPLVINGCCGNINPWPPFQPNFHPDHKRMGLTLAEAAEQVLYRLSFAPTEALEGRTQVVRLPLRAPEAEALAQARQVLEEHPEVQWEGESRTKVAGDWMRAALTMSVHLLREREGSLPYEIQALRVGETALVGLPGEPFVEGQLAIKIGSPAYPTYVAHCTTQYVGYLPTREAFARGGHEVNLSYWAKVAPGSLETVVEQAIGLLREVFAP